MGLTKATQFTNINKQNPITNLNKYLDYYKRIIFLSTPCS